MQAVNQLEAGPGPARVALVVVEDPVLRRLMSAILRQQGFRVVEARSMSEGKQAFNAAGGTPGLVIACLEARRRGDVLAAIAKFSVREPRLRIIVTSASNPDLTEMEIMQALGIQFLSLPYSFAQFIRAVGECSGTTTRTAFTSPAAHRGQSLVRSDVCLQ